MDWPSIYSVPPTVISTLSVFSIGQHGGAIHGGSSPASGAWPANNRAIYVPLALPFPYRLVAFFWLNGTAVSSNVDCGIYSRNGALISSTGSTAQSGGSLPQVVTLGTPILLAPGQYYLALALSSTGGRIFRQNLTTIQAQYLGIGTEGLGGLPLPDPFTLATPASGYMPVFGIARVTTI